METLVSIKVHESRVSLILTLKYSLKSQKPPSLICEKVMLPAPVASTSNSGDTPEEATEGIMILAAVSPATVADPTLTLISAAINQAIKNGDSPRPAIATPI